MGNLVRAEAVKSMARSERIKNLSRTYATGFVSGLPVFHLLYLKLNCYELNMKVIDSILRLTKGPLLEI